MNAWYVGVPWAEAALLLAAAVLLPLAWPLIVERRDEDARAAGLLRLARRVRLPAALCLIAAFLLPPGTKAAALSLPWAVFAALCGTAGLLRLRRDARRSAAEIALDLGLAYMAGGAAWAVVSRYGLRPMQFEPIIVLLTAVHFHYAGFLLPLLSAAACRAAPGIWSRFAALGSVAGVPLLAAGFAFSPPLELAAALLITAASVALAAVQLRLALRGRNPAALWLLTLSAVSLLSGMALAGAYAWGEYSGRRFLDIPSMLPLHGAVNGLGFALCGLLGWRQMERS